MSGLTRDGFMGRVRSALHAWRQSPSHSALPPAPHLNEPAPIRTSAPPLRPVNGDLTAQFASMLTAAGGHVYQATSSDEAVQLALDVAHSKGAKHVIFTRHPELVRFPLAFVADGLTVTIVGFTPGETPSPAQRETQRDMMARADVVVSGADYAIAETGTLAMVAGAHNPRTATLLPPIHIAILDPTRLLPTMPDLVARFKADHLRDGKLDISGLTFITGPSRTGDIEQTLSVGVHGPGEVHVIILPT